jgi:hypothetical protein
VVVIFLDGPKNDLDQEHQTEILNYLSSDFPFRSMEVRVSKENKGLAKSIRHGVTEMLHENTRLIVLEDDLILSPSFLDYMNQALSFYADTQEVASIHGYQYPIDGNFNQPIFFRGTDCWGWATWSDRWATASFDSQRLLAEIDRLDLVDSFNLSGGMNFYKMLEHQASGLIDSWAICWHASMFLQNRFTLFPTSSLVQNNGNDGSGVHSGENNFFETELTVQSEWNFPVVIDESILLRNLLSDFYRQSLGKKNVLVRVVRKVARIIKGIKQ